MSSPGATTRKSSLDNMSNIFSPTISSAKGLANRVRAGSSGSGIQLANSNEAAVGADDIPLTTPTNNNNNNNNVVEDDDNSSYGDMNRNDSNHFFGEEEDDADVLLLDALAPGERTVGQFDLCGSMWKRRGGLGRNAGKNWVLRCFTLYGGILCYHEEPDIESVSDPSKPRARLNLAKTETIAEMHSKDKPGLPSADLLTINIYDPIIHAKRKWEMCCTSKEQQLVWYKAINAFNGAPPEKERKKERKSERGGGEPNEATAVSPAPYEQRIRPSTMIRTMDDVDLIAKAAAKAAEIVMEKQQEQSKQTTGLSIYQITVLVVALNVAMHAARNGTESTYKLTLFMMNVAVLYCATQSSKGSATPRRGPKARALAKAKSKKGSEDTSSMESGKIHSPRAVPSPTNKHIANEQLLMGNTIPRATPTKDSELGKQLQNHPPTSAEAVRAYSSAAPDTSSVEAQPHSYSNTNASLFNLRVGPNYKKNKQKAPSGPALYDLVTTDFLYADTALKNVADKFTIPTIPGITDVSTGHAHIPPMLVVNTWLPGEEPSMFAKGNGSDAENYSIPMILVLSKDTLDQLKDLGTASPGVKLLSEWCRRAEHEADFRGRFKCMGMIEDIESTGVPKFIQGYNGKPALVTKSGTFKRHENYIEFTINVNMWAFLAKKGLYTLTPTFPDFITNIGFTIEARCDDEMPEVLLGGCRLLNLDPEQAAVEGVDV